MKKFALVLCATLWLLGVGAVATAQAGQGAGNAGTGQALGNAQAVDETALSLGGTAGGQAQSAAQAAGSSTLAYFLRMVLVLAIVLAAIWLLFRFMKKAQRPAEDDSTVLRVLASTRLGSGRSVHVVSLGSKAWLVGAAESSVSLIAEVEDREVIDELELKASTEANKPRADFQAVLAGVLGKGRKAGASKAGRGGADFGADFLGKQRDRLKKY